MANWKDLTKKVTEDAVPAPAAEAPTRDLVRTGVMTEFGELLDDPDHQMKMGGQKIDMCYTPGWSEMRWQRDNQMAEVAQGKRSAKDVAALPVNVRLVRRSKPSGTPEGMKQIQSANRGYRPILKSDVGQPWFEVMPTGATELADGTITKGDCVYMVCPSEQAARNAYEKDRTTRQRLTGAAERAESAGVRYESTLMPSLKGAPPSKINVT